MSKVIERFKKQRDKTVFKALSIDIIKADEDETVLCMKIDDRHRQPMGAVHGGVYALLVESAASIAASCAQKNNEHVVGLEVNANHVRSLYEGTLYATAHPYHKGSRTLVYEVAIRDEDKRLISIGRCTLMNIGGQSGLAPEPNAG